MSIDRNALRADATVDFPGGGRGTLCALRCDTCGQLFLPIVKGPDGEPEVQPAFSVGGVDVVAVIHDGHALTYYAVLDDGEEITGPLKVWAHWSKAREGAVLQ